MFNLTMLLGSPSYGCLRSLTAATFRLAAGRVRAFPLNLPLVSWAVEDACFLCIDLVVVELMQNPATPLRGEDRLPKQ